MPAFAQQAEDWRTEYEISGCVASPDYAHTLDYCRRLAVASPMIRMLSMGITPQGRNIPLLVVSKDSLTTFESVRNGQRPVVLIQAGIHAGEIDGKDAGLMLLRDIAITGSLRHLVDNVIILFLPIFNLDGHERRGPYNRINQNGPVETGWRVTANNLNLNRDFMKADAPEMRAWLRMVHQWEPDLIVDIHVTDGIDFQYNLTYSMEMYDNAAPEIVAWQKTLEKALIAGMKRQGDPIVPYVITREDNDLSSGLLSYAAPPRFSTGYAAVRNRAAILVETHMLKPYKDRVTATLRLLTGLLTHVNADPAALRSATHTADSLTARLFTSSSNAPFTLRYRNTFTNPQTIEFQGYEMERRPGAVSGGAHPVWDHSRPTTVRVPYWTTLEPQSVVRPPVAYIIPNEWNEVLSILTLHGVTIERLADTVSLPVERYQLSEPVWQTRSYEGRHPLRVKVATRLDTVRYPKGTMVVRLDQPKARIAIHLLEPDGPDSFLGWGFMDAIFEQKEYFEEYVMEPVAAGMLARDPALKAEFDARLATDTTFARTPRARLQFFYERSPWADPMLGVYPIARFVRADGLPSVSEQEFRRLNQPRKK